jgi:hypothetical protein
MASNASRRQRSRLRSKFSSAQGSRLKSAEIARRVLEVPGVCLTLRSRHSGPCPQIAPPRRFGNFFVVARAVEFRARRASRRPRAEPSGLVRCVTSVTLTADQRFMIRQAIDTERRRIVQPKTTASFGSEGTGNSLADWCLTEARGDPLTAVGLAVTARATVRRRQAVSAAH